MIQRKIWVSKSILRELIFESSNNLENRNYKYTNSPLNSTDLCVLVNEESPTFTKENNKIKGTSLLKSSIEVFISEETYYNLPNIFSIQSRDNGDGVTASFEVTKGYVIGITVPINTIQIYNKDRLEIFSDAFSMFNRNKVENVL